MFFCVDFVIYYRRMVHLVVLSWAGVRHAAHYSKHPSLYSDVFMP